MGRISPSLLAFSLLVSLLIVLLLEILWTWAWAIRRLWKGIPLLVDDRTTPHKPAPWGGLTVLLLVFLYLGVNIAVSRVYAVSTGRSLTRVARAAENQAGAGADKETDRARNADSVDTKGQTPAIEKSRELMARGGGTGPRCPTGTIPCRAHVSVRTE